MEDEGRRPLRLRRSRGAEQARQEAVLQRPETCREKKTRNSQDSFLKKIVFKQCEAEEVHKKFIKRAQVSVLQRRNKGYAAWYCKASKITTCSTCTVVRKDTCHLPPGSTCATCCTPPTSCWSSPCSTWPWEGSSGAWG